MPQGEGAWQVAIGDARTSRSLVHPSRHTEDISREQGVWTWRISQVRGGAAAGVTLAPERDRDGPLLLTTKSTHYSLPKVLVPTTTITTTTSTHYYYYHYYYCYPQVGAGMSV